MTCIAVSLTVTMKGITPFKTTGILATFFYICYSTIFVLTLDVLTDQQSAYN